VRPRAAPRRRRRPELIAVLAVACGTSSPVATRDVDGRLAVDGKPRTIVACEVRERADGVELRLALDGGGVVSYAEAQRRFAVDDQPYKCTAGAARDIRFGPGFFHGGLAFTCHSGPSTLSGDLTLRCGEIDEATRVEMQREIDNARKSEPNSEPK